MDYYCYCFTLDPYEPYAEILSAELAEMGFESFAEEDPQLKAYVPVQNFEEKLLENVAILKNPELKSKYVKELIKQENWNRKWEESFDPITIDNYCIIRAPFHAQKDGFTHELIIEPKMSFGTGHHATTRLMIRLMQTIELEGKQIVDMGSGTGILAILARKEKAARVTAIEIEEWAFKNIIENTARNQVEVNVMHGGAEKLALIEQKADIILANINLNVIQEQLPLYLNLLKKNGHLLLSGFYVSDKQKLLAFPGMNTLKVNVEREEDQWCAIHFRK